MNKIRTQKKKLRTKKKEMSKVKIVVNDSLTCLNPGQKTTLKAVIRKKTSKLYSQQHQTLRP